MLSTYWSKNKHISISTYTSRILFPRSSGQGLYFSLYLKIIYWKRGPILLTASALMLSDDHHMENIESEYTEFCKYQQPIVQSWQHFSFSAAHISLLGFSTSLCLTDWRRTKQENKGLKLMSEMQLLGEIFFWFSMRWLKDLYPGMLNVMSTCTADFRRNSVSGLNLPSASQTSRHQVPAVITHLPSGTRFWCWGTAVLVAGLVLAAPFQPATCTGASHG